MRSPSPERWTDQLWRATITLLAAAIGLYIAWQLISSLIVPLVIVAVLLFVLRIVFGVVGGRNQW